MRTAIFTAILNCSVFFAWGQARTIFLTYNAGKPDESLKYQTDTLIFETRNARNILYGTMALPWTSNQQLAKNYGLYLDSVTSAGCQEEIFRTNEPFSRVMSVVEEKDLLTITINYWGNCCHSFLGDIEVKDDLTLNLIVHGYGATYCECSCFTSLTYHFSTLKVPEFDTLKYLIINNEEKSKKLLR